LTTEETNSSEKPKVQILTKESKLAEKQEDRITKYLAITFLDRHEQNLGLPGQDNTDGESREGNYP
jgi:hypothetical protein